MPADPASQPTPALPTADPEIPSLSERQTMDWGVALLSQGINSTPLHDANGWRLRIPHEHYDAALAVLTLYTRENRRWLWQPSSHAPELLFHWGALAWGGLILFMEIWSRTAGPSVRASGLMNSEAVQQGEWWRLFTAITLHADLAHLMANLTTGIILLGLAMARWSAGTALLAAWCAGALGNVAGLLLHSQHYLGLGASGMVMGALGLLATASWPTSPQAHAPGLLLRGLLGAVLLFILIGVNPSSDIIAHLGGFAAGLSIGAAVNLLPRHSQHPPWASLVAGIVTAASLISSWALALLHS